MDDTMTVTFDEICAVATKIDAGEPLDGDDQVIMRALLVLAAERVAELAEGASEVEGFSFDLGAPPVNTTFGLSLAVSKLQDKSSPQLFLHCCTGKHFPQATITT